MNLALCHTLVELGPRHLTHGTSFLLVILTHRFLSKKYVTNLGNYPVSLGREALRLHADCGAVDL